jgi:amino-acid N-acetyltransferase
LVDDKTDPLSAKPSALDKLINDPKSSPIINAILNPVYRRTALVKIQGPFTDRQLDSITTGMIYLQRLGLVSVIVVENEDLVRGEDGDRVAIVAETMRVVDSLEKHHANARPILSAVVRLGPKPDDRGTSSSNPIGFRIPEAHTIPSDLAPIRSALNAGEIPVVSPVALDSFCRTVRVDSNDVIGALARGMVEVASEGSRSTESTDGQPEHSDEVDLTPLRLMIINREGGVPSYARFGYPHLLINLTSEFAHIAETFQQDWASTHPTALKNLSLASTCLAYMPPSSSAVIVNHRSPSSLIANLITNKPALSSSLPHALLQGNRKLTPHTPTLLRRGMDIRVVRTVQDIDKQRLTALLEQSFNRTLDEKAFYERLESSLDFVIIAGDYAGAAVVTSELPLQTPVGDGGEAHVPIMYLDKFAVLPRHQGDGTVDFLWVALHDETYGLGHPFSVNPNGGKEGKGEAKDLVWRSRATNPVNKWYFERSTGHIRLGDWILFWCDAEGRLRTEEGRRANAGLSFIEEWEENRLPTWAEIVTKIPSSWTK